ncbi:MAG: hypothetical protein PHD67_08605 [Oscillospiraceae bacterium]|nr:hypothetical protein [Oscillospiraceae bacterium]
MPGLNVVIGGSSSGKTLFVDSIYRKTSEDFSGGDYSQFDVASIQIVNPANLRPHYINQNFIMSILSNEDRGIEEIDMVSKVFPLDEEIDKQIQVALAEVKNDVYSLINCAKNLEDDSDELSRIPIISRLIVEGTIKKNIISLFVPDPINKPKYTLKSQKYDDYASHLKEIGGFLSANPFCNDISTELKTVEAELEHAYRISKFESAIYEIISAQKKSVDEQLKSEDMEKQSKSQNLEKLYELIEKYVANLNSFYLTLGKIAKYDVKCNTDSLIVMGHELSIENHFSLSKDIVLAAINKFLKTEYKIVDFARITPESLLIDRFSKKSPKISSYDIAKKNIYAEIEKSNRKTYKIITKDGQAFETLSPGWKSAILLDIILGYDRDAAPLIIDQPEDNLATNYINSDLIQSIKKMKTCKQIILVSHNATIPIAW